MKRVRSRPQPGTLRYRWRKARQRTTRALGVRFGARFIRHLSRRCERTELHRELRDRLEEEGPILIALWHGRSAAAAPFFPADSIAVLVSASEDGKVATTILGKLGYEIIRGSSSRGGARAVRDMLAALRAGKHVALTPDGPRGPMHSMSPGIAFLARATGAPILPAGIAVDRAWELSSWDHYTIPRPGAHLVCAYQEPLRIPRDVSGAALAEWSSELRRRLRAAEREAAQHLGREPDWIDWAPEEEAEYGGEF